MAEQTTEKAHTSEVYNGRKISVRVDPKRGQVLSYVNGHLLGSTYGTTPEVATRELRILRAWIDMADERRRSDPTAYPDHFYEGADDA